MSEQKTPTYPQSGGSYIRHGDGSLTRARGTHAQEPAPEVAQAAPETEPGHAMKATAKHTTKARAKK